MSDAYDFPVDRTGILLFASALGESNPIYYDAEYAASTPLGGVVAPPTFAIASHHWDPTHVFRGVREIPPPPDRDEAGGSDRARQGEGGSGRLARVLHAEQRFEYFGPVRPGSTLRASTRPGKSWTKQGRRGGALEFRESITEYHDEEGRLVVRATSVGVVTSKAVES